MWLENSLSLNGTLCKKEKNRRALFLTINAGAMLFTLLLFSNFDLKWFVSVAATVVSVSTALFAIATILCKRTLSKPMIVCVGFSYAFAICLADLTARSASVAVMWTANIIVVDMLLVMQVDPRYSLGLVCATVVWLCVVWLEERFRFGLLDMPGLYSQEERLKWHDQEASCSKLPCPDTAVTNMVVGVMVFVLDFVATRTFANNLLKEQAAMERMINTVQEIASLLAGYEVEKVAELLEANSSDLPEGMIAALRTLEENLRGYKAYLPQTCLLLDDEDTSPRALIRRQSTRSSGLSRASSSSSLNSLLSETQPPRTQSLSLSSVKATLLTINVRDTLHLLDESCEYFSELFTELLLRTLYALQGYRGIVDVFVGDRIHCSFNTSKPCASHAVSALYSATLLMKCDAINIGVCTGKVLRGDMGCDVMRRFSMVGALVRDVLTIERAGRFLDCAVLLNRLCFSDAECEHDVRLVPCKVELVSGYDTEIVAELSEPSGGACDSEEWMYQVGGAKRWDAYNVSVRGYLKGTESDTTVAKLWAEAGGIGNAPNAVPYGICPSLCLGSPSFRGSDMVTEEQHTWGF